MEESWIYDGHEDVSSNYSLTDSDKIDSETEAELYSKIHHESNLSCISSDNLNQTPSRLQDYSPFKNILCVDDASATSDHAFLNQIASNSFSNKKRKSSEIETDCKSEKLDCVKKHKSESLTQSVNLDSYDMENINDSFQFKKSNIKNKNIILNSDSNDKSNNKKDIVILDSSDSDSDIWIEPNYTKTGDLKINLLNDTDNIFMISSDSDNDTSPFGKRDSVLRNLSMPNIKTKEHSKELWNINYEDLYRSKKHSNRYHENYDITCSNCKSKGHTFRTCPSPKVIKCFVCGGNHMGFRCSNRMCSNCHASGHDRRNCWREVYRGFCHLCNMEGHAKANCPDLWRRYHLTTRPSKMNKGKQIQQNTNFYCWNCGKHGHFGAVCPVSRPSNNSFNTWPCVISYDNPKHIFKDRLSKKYSRLNMEKLNKSVNSISRFSSENKNIHLRPSNELNISSKFNEENKGKKNKKKKSRTALRFNKIQNIVKEKNFPRTPKKSPIKCSNNFVQSEEAVESPQLLIQKQLKKLKYQWNKQITRTNIQFSEINQDDVSKMLNEKCPINHEDGLPEYVKFQIEKKFRKWKRNRIRRLKKSK